MNADVPATLADRPYDDRRGWPIPFVHELDDGSYDLNVVNRARAVQCALSRICAMCAQSLGYPLAFLGDESAARSRTYTYPPMHAACAEAALRLYPHPPGRTLLVTASFDVERPQRRGEPLLFRPAPGEVRSARGEVPPAPGEVPPAPQG